MRARIVPPYPSFTYVMSQIDNSPDESRAGSQGHDDAPLRSVPRPYSKYDDNPFMRTVRYNHDDCARNSVSAPPAIRSSRGHPSLYSRRSKPSMSLPLVGKFLQKHTSALSQRRKVSSAV